MTINWEPVGLTIAIVGALVCGGAIGTGMEFRVFFMGLGIIAIGWTIFEMERAGLIPRLGAKSS